ncbi:helix-turn-helix transcriptional regulator [Saccharopolyspora phatthalungensis]|uniref:Uncharacterized protein n=1 Tax=Saccharopolyspora phatthalungensis TaxID=664693 RepID=A0A840PYP6_9PSEU|nr:hypothetical protein [Saccharopolyspora phatthalungensis]MBB5152887.1 hypothetical protein [Saccharopolyspora phatthalungensis]
MTDSEATLTLRDIAALAGVQRAVVSAWRTRPMVRGRSIPFPAPIDDTGGLARFRRDEIVEWLRATGRGNNPEMHLDAPAWSAPDGASLEELVALLCLRSATGDDLGELGHDELVDLAEEIDPKDRCLVREVRAATVDTVRYVEDLAEASRGPDEALDLLERGRVAREHATRELTDTAIDLVRTVATACARDLDPYGVPLIHTDGPHRLTLTVAADFTELIVPDFEPGDDHRALLRRAMIRGVETATETALPSIHLRSVLGSDTASVLDDIDNVILGLGPNDVAMILGPASMLCDDLRGDAESDRARTLRPGNLAFAARLPRGLWREAHRQALGLWICTGRTDSPLRVTDIATLDELDADDLAADAVAALNDDSARAFRYARPRELAAVLSKQPVVPRGIRAARFATTEPAEHRDRVIAATQRTAEPLPGFDVLVSPAAGTIAVSWSSLGQLENQKLLKIKRGKRYNEDDHDPDGTVDVVGASGPTGIRLDPIEAAQRHPHAPRTDSGDVVFAKSPPEAWVDPIGGSLLRAPARIIRLAPGAGIGPHTLAAIINRLPDTAGDPLAWNVPRLETGVQELDDALAAATAYEARLRERLNALQNLTEFMINGAAEGAITIVGHGEN